MRIGGNTSRGAVGEQAAHLHFRVCRILQGRRLVFILLLFAGCTSSEPAATVEGTLRHGGKPLDNCLITFLPGAAKNVNAPHSTGLTDSQGKFRLRHDNQQEGVVVGTHRVVIQDLSITTGVQRRDHGTVDAEMEDAATPTAARPSRVPKAYTSAATTPLSLEVKPGHQVIDLDIP